MDDGLAWRTIFSVASLAAYTAMAVFLLWYTLHRFEIVVGRARRSPMLLPPASKVTPASSEPQLVIETA
jgi:hypothetical protein